VVDAQRRKISTEIGDGSFCLNPALVAACTHAKTNNSTLHLMGLIGAGGVHAIDTHLFALIDLARRENVPSVAIHAFTDGRDTLPKAGLGYMLQLFREIADSPARIATVSGRYYAMDRDKRWQRTELA